MVTFRFALFIKTKYCGQIVQQLNCKLKQLIAHVNKKFSKLSYTTMSINIIKHPKTTSSVALT